ncbi:hypothetical protein H0H93_001003 [Arthromyces matolae]|nr:hypothetical protein H0H93_001003 [Arthromyces matolae]
MPRLVGRSSSSMASLRLTLRSVVSKPCVLARLASCLDWSSFHALLCTCKATRRLFDDPALRALILARYVPGFDAFRDYAVKHDSPLTIDLRHLHLFLVSQSVPVHLYPTHALRSVFALVPHIDDSEPLAALAQAHSRFVLLLQSLVYSSQNITIPHEPLPPFLPEKLAPPVPELTSPGPLSYKASVPPPPRLNRVPLSKPKLRFFSESSRQLSINLFRSPSSTPFPSPVSDPYAIRAYSSTWRRTIPYKYSSGASSQSESDNELVPPRRHYVSSRGTSTTDSQTSLSRSTTPTPPTSHTSSSPSPPPSRIRLSLSPLSALSPYDFTHAVSPVRAPVLRTYVPCANPVPHPQTIGRCEEQLISADLWSHLSVGDIVVNLGHVPLANESGKSTGSSEKSRHTSLHRSQSAPQPAIHWLMFNGSFLVPFSPQPGKPIPVQDPLLLPSPFYFTHILPRLANPTFTLRRMPRFLTVIPAPHSNGTTYERATEPEEGDIPMRLVYLPARVTTTHGSGVAIVRRYKWLARVYVDAPRAEEPEVGQGWQGEWILEGDGTKEGRETLLDWLLGRGRLQARPEGKGKERESDDKEVEWDWELVRERCRKGRMWFKLISTRKYEDDVDAPSAEGLSLSSLGLNVNDYFRNKDTITNEL